MTSSHTSTIGIFALLFIFVYPKLSASEVSLDTKRKAHNISVLGESYGYVKFFHPKKNMDWDCFLKEGISIVQDANSHEDLIVLLNNHFSQISPFIKFYADSTLQLPIIAEKKICYYEHYGYGGFGDQYYINLLHKFISLYRTKLKTSGLKNISKNLAVTKSCFQITDSIYLTLSFVTPKKNYKKKSSDCLANESPLNPLTEIINYWNVIKHFYPYWNTTNIDWDKELLIAIDNYLNHQDLFNILLQLNSKINDGHGGIKKLKDYYYYPNIYADRISDKIIIKNCMYCDTLDVNIGDEILYINNVEAKTYYDSVFNTIPMVRFRTRELFTNLFLFRGNKDSLVNFTIKRNDTIADVVLKRIFYNTYSTPIIRDIHKVKEGIYYINPAIISYKEIMKFIKNNNVKSLIIDYRYYPGNITKLNTHLTKTSMTTQFFLIPKIKYPMELGLIEYDSIQSKSKPKKPFINILPVYLIDANTASKGETHISMIKNNKIGVIIGENTGGTNGDMNMFKLNDSTIASFTGSRVLNQELSEFHQMGISPDIEVKLTQEKFLKNDDPILEEAIKYIDEYFEKNQ